MANKYKVTVVFKNGGKTDHTIKETWTNLSAKGVRDTLKESLDVFVDDNGKPAVPVKSKLVERIGKYFPDDTSFVDSEYARMTAEWPLYSGALAFLKSGKAKWTGKANGILVKVETV